MEIIGLQSGFSNQILLNFGRSSNSAKYISVTLPQSYSNLLYNIQVNSYWNNNDTGGSNYNAALTYGSNGTLLTTSGFRASVPNSNSAVGTNWFTIGY